MTPAEYGARLAEKRLARKPLTPEQIEAAVRILATVEEEAA